MIKSVSKNKGGILMEAMVAMAIFAIGMSFVLLLFVSSSKGALYSLEGTKASLMETQSMEAVRSILNDRGWLPVGTYEVGLKDNKEWDIISTDGLVGHWKLSGDANDYSGNGNHGTLVGGVTWAEDRMGQARGSAEFDGVDGYVAVDDQILLTSSYVTVSAWIKTLGKLDSSQIIIAKRTSLDNDQFEFRINPSYNLNFDRYLPNSGSVSSINTVPLNEWVFVSMTFDDVENEVEFYINGVLDSVNFYTEAYEGDSSSIITIGRSGVSSQDGTSDPWRSFNGQIDDVRIYNRALSEDEIKALYGHYSEKYQPKVTVGDGITDGLVGYWPMNEGEGKYVYDYSPRTDNWGKMFGPYLNFDGTDDYVDCGDINEPIEGKNNFSIGYWINLEQNKNYNTHMGTVAGSDYNLGWNVLSTVDGSLFFVADDTAGSPWGIAWDTGYNLTTNEWVHIVFTRDGDVFKLYINGSYYGTTTNSLTIGSGAYNLQIGSSGDERFVDGKIDDVRIYNRALSAEEVSKLYKGEWVSDTGLVGHWDMDEGYGGQVSDKSGNGNHGTINGATWGDNSPEWVDDVSGGALDFDGVDDYVNAGNDASLQLTNQMTISSWIKTEGNTNSRVGGKSSSGHTSFYLYSRFLVSGNGSSQSHTDVVLSEDGVWEHRVGVYNGTAGILKLYVNSVDVTGSITGTIPTSLYNSSAPFKIGVASTLMTESDAHLQGQISDVRIYNRALSATEIQKIYEYGRTNKFYTSE
ncbi:MAG: LamG domain-containing protein [Candidatus Pacebacteria bacterium]|nr:LamG domain-containing protein [Candidatus Paceibacterota bacterium]